MINPDRLQGKIRQSEILFHALTRRRTGSRRQCAMRLAGAVRQCASSFMDSTLRLRSTVHVSAVFGSAVNASARAEPYFQLMLIERFGDVIVRSGFHSLDQVFAGARRLRGTRP